MQLNKRAIHPYTVSMGWLALVGLLGAGPASRPADPTLDWLMDQASTAPTSQPATQPASQPSPFGEQVDPEVRKGTLVLSNGQRITGRFATTREKPLRVWDDKANEYRDVPFKLVASLDAVILWERDEKEWHFKDSGSDIKEYSGKTYPARELQYKVTLLNGQTLTGGIVAPLYNITDDGNVTYVLNKREKGPLGQPLAQLVYVKHLELE